MTNDRHLGAVIPGTMLAVCNSPEDPSTHTLQGRGVKRLFDESTPHHADRPGHSGDRSLVKLLNKGLN